MTLDKATPQAHKSSTAIGPPIHRLNSVASAKAAELWPLGKENLSDAWIMDAKPTSFSGGRSRFKPFLRGQYKALSSSMVEARAGKITSGNGCSTLNIAAINTCRMPSPLRENTRAVLTQGVC